MVQGDFVLPSHLSGHFSNFAFEDPEEVIFSWGPECGSSIYLAIEKCLAQVGMTAFLRDHERLGQYKDPSKFF